MYVDNMIMNAENPHGGLDHFKSSNNNNSNINNSKEDDNPSNVGSTSVFDKTRSETQLSSEDDNNNPGGSGSRSIFSKHGKRPTSAREPSSNVSTRCDISVACEIRWIHGEY